MARAKIEMAPPLRSAPTKILDGAHPAVPLVSGREAKGPSILEGIVESREEGCVVLSPTTGAIRRRVLYVNSYGGVAIWERIKQGALPSHHLWGCLELARMGYQVLLAEPLPHFNLRRRPVPHDLRLLRFAMSWLGKDDILYSAHTLLYWLPLVSALGIARRKIVSLTYAREDLDFAGAHCGIIGLTPAAADQARKIAPRAKVVHLGWGADLGFFPLLPYRPEWLLSCGRTHRDHRTLCAAAAESGARLRVISPQLPSDLKWSHNVTLKTGGETDTTVSYHELLQEYYARCGGALIVLKEDPTEKTAVGFTSLLEAMAMARPVIVTRTGALPGEMDVEREGCGIHVPPVDAKALSLAMTRLLENPSEAQSMGRKGRWLCESRYNSDRFSRELHHFFEQL